MKVRLGGRCGLLAGMMVAVTATIATRTTAQFATPAATPGILLDNPPNAALVSHTEGRDQETLLIGLANP